MKRLYTLIRRQEAFERLRVEVAVGMSNECPRKTKDARIAREWAVGELGQLAIKAGRQIFSDFADLRFDEMVIVEQPFSRRHNITIIFEFDGACAVSSQQNDCIVIEAGAQPRYGRRSVCYRLRFCEGNSMLLETLQPKYLVADWRCVAPQR
ncbi:hypothetical protein GCM10009076_29760 [Erythrobacter ramosus]